MYSARTHQGAMSLNASIVCVYNGYRYRSAVSLSLSFSLFLSLPLSLYLSSLPSPPRASLSSETDLGRAIEKEKNCFTLCSRVCNVFAPATQRADGDKQRVVPR